MIVLDTHALLWWALDPLHLSPAALAATQEMEQRGGYASSMSIWELGIKIRRGALDIGLPIEDFAARIERSGIVRLLPVDTAVWLRSLDLAWDHRDPADRVIVATALVQGIPLVTADQVIHRFDGVKWIW